MIFTCCVTDEDTFRVRALYINQPKVVWFVASILLAEIAVNAWLLTHGQGEAQGYYCSGY